MIRYFWPSDDEQLAGQWTDSHFDEDGGWWANVQQCGAALALVVAATIVSSSTAAAQGVFPQQDDPAGSLTFQQAVPEEYMPLTALPPPVNWPQTDAFRDDDVIPTFVQVFTPDDGDWKPLVSPVVDSNYVRLPFLDPEEIPQLPAANNPLDDGPAWNQNTPWEPNWTLLFFLDDGSTVPVFQYDEDFLPVQALPASYNWPQPAQPFTATDETVPEFVAEDVVWQQLVQPVADSLLWPQPFTFEQNESTNLVAFTTEEHNWPNPVPVPDSIWLLRQDAFDTQDPAGSLTLTLDDSFQPLVIPGVPLPDPGGFGLLQQWPFEQNEPAGSLRNNVDEDFWINPVAPVVWPQVLPFVFDEVPGHAPNTGQDEDFWNLLVAPVAASNYLRFPYGGYSLTDPEEIPAGSLAVPPPPVPCKPPKGFDPDTTITYFGGTTPTQVLLCRICNSGKPLLVRGDYAIWCQDCCAFVSKADTVMGTVRAPGAFRGRF